MNVAIIDDDMDTADLGKTQIENAQRKRRAEGTDHPIRFFALEDDFWELQDLRRINKKKLKESEEQEKEKEQAQENRATKTTDTDEEKGETEPKDDDLSKS